MLLWKIYIHKLFLCLFNIPFLLCKFATLFTYFLNVSLFIAIDTEIAILAAISIISTRTIRLVQEQLAF